MPASFPVDMLWPARDVPAEQNAVPFVRLGRFCISPYLHDLICIFIMHFRLW